MKKGNKKKVSSVTESTLPKIKNKNSKSKSPQQKVTSAKSKNSTTINEEKINNITSIKYNNNTSNTSKLDEYNEKRKKRLLLEKKEEERDKKIYEQVLKEFQDNKVKNENRNKTKLTEGKNRNNDINYQLPNIKISEKKTQKILEEGGMLDAYKYLIIQLCKNGLPIGNLFEYSAMVIKNYEKKWKDKKAKLKKEQVEQYWKEKKEQVDSFSELQKSVKMVEPVEHRLSLTKYYDITIIDDAYNSNPMGSKMALEVLKMMPGKHIVVTPGMIEVGAKEDEVNKEFGRQIADNVDEAILIGEEKTKPIYEGLIEKGFPKEHIHVLNDVLDAFPLMLELKDKDTYALLENDLPDSFSEKIRSDKK